MNLKYKINIALACNQEIKVLISDFCIHQTHLNPKSATRAKMGFRGGGNRNEMHTRASLISADPVYLFFVSESQLTLSHINLSVELPNLIP